MCVYAIYVVYICILYTLGVWLVHEMCFIKKRKKKEERIRDAYLHVAAHYTSMFVWGFCHDFLIVKPLLFLFKMSRLHA